MDSIKRAIKECQEIDKNMQVGSHANDSLDSIDSMKTFKILHNKKKVGM